MRKVLIPVAVIALAIATAAVGGRSEAACGRRAELRQGRPVLVKDGQLTIGTDNPAYPPWFAGGETKGKSWKINDPNKGKGFESAVAYAVAKRLGFAEQVLWVYTPFNRRSRRPEAVRLRDQPVLVHARAGEGARLQLLVLQRQPVDRRAEGKADLVGAIDQRPAQVRLGAQLGTTSYQYIVNTIKPSPSVKVYDSNDLAVAALKNGQIDGLVVDLPTAFYVTAVQVPNGKIIGQFPAKGNQERSGWSSRRATRSFVREERACGMKGRAC